MAEYTTEEVTENRSGPGGSMYPATFWIAYPPHISGLGHMEDRISAASGRGATEAEALADARKPILPRYSVIQKEEATGRECVVYRSESDTRAYQVRDEMEGVPGHTFEVRWPD